MTTKHQPATPLPWAAHANDVHGPAPKERTVMRKTVANCGHAMEDAAYIAHAANAYPKLVEALREVLPDLIYGTTGRWKGKGSEKLEALLRELGEKS